jgi:hypothetical protein
MANTENQQVKTKRQTMTERLQSRYPDMNIEDDEAVFGAISDDYDNYDKDIAGYQEREKAFSDMFTSDPRSASFIQSWRNGDDPVLVLVRQFGTDIKDAIDDPERQEAIAEANKEFLGRVAKEKELEEQYQQNLGASLKSIEELQAKNNLTDEQVDEAMSLIVQIANDAILGKFTPETIDMAMKAINHDQDVAAAAHEAEVRGKNTRAEERLRKPNGDGMPALNGKNGAGGAAKPRRSLGALDNFGDNNKTIWERGNEKRTPR